MTHRKRRIILAATLAVVLPVGAGAVWAADRFLIPHVEISDVQAYEAENSTVATTDTTSATEPVTTATTYTSDDANVTISTVVTGTGDDTVTYYVADVALTDATAWLSEQEQYWNERIDALIDHLEENP